MSKYNLKIDIYSEVLYNVGQDIRKRRQNLNISQKQFAKCVRMDESNYCKFELGKMNISLLQYLEILDNIKFFEKVDSDLYKILECGE